MSQAECFRTFLAITPDDAVLETLQENTGRLRQNLESLGVRWEPRAKWHVTLRFLGDVRSSEIPDLCAAIEEACRGKGCFPAKVEGIGAFPSVKRPRVLWAGIESEGENLADLHDALSAATDRFTAKPDEKRFRPHLTLARIRTENRRILAQIAPTVQPFHTTNFGRWEVKGVELWRSTLQPGGSRYELLRQTALET